jgi:hypothetical protein
VGLGLSLVQAIAKLHGGSLELGDNHPGLRASMIIERGASTPSVAPEHRIDGWVRQRDVELTA